MSDSYISTDAGREARGTDAPITVFVNRAGFERGISRMLMKSAGECAVLHLTLRSKDAHTGCVGRKLLNLAGNTLRAAMRRGGAAVYLGNAEFAVFLRGASAREAAAYARTVIGIIDGLQVTWDHEVLSISAAVGGTMVGDEQDGAALLEQAITAGELARGRLGCKLHIRYSQEQLPALLRPVTATGAALLA